MYAGMYVCTFAGMYANEVSNLFHRSRSAALRQMAAGIDLQQSTGARTSKIGPVRGPYFGP